MMKRLAADAACVVSSVGWHCFHAATAINAGICCVHGVLGGFSANLLPGQLDAYCSIAEASVETVFGDFSVNIAGNWFFIAAMISFLPVIWFVTDEVIEPRLGRVDPSLAAATGAGTGDQL